MTTDFKNIAAVKALFEDGKKLSDVEDSFEPAGDIKSSSLLLNAVSQGAGLDVVEFLIGKGSNASKRATKRDYETSVLFEACKYCDVSVVKYLCEKKPEIVETEKKLSDCLPFIARNIRHNMCDGLDAEDGKNVLKLLFVQCPDVMQERNLLLRGISFRGIESAPVRFALRQTINDIADAAKDSQKHGIDQAKEIPLTEHTFTKNQNDTNSLSMIRKGITLEAVTHLVDTNFFNPEKAEKSLFLAACLSCDVSVIKYLHQQNPDLIKADLTELSTGITINSNIIGVYDNLCKNPKGENEANVLRFLLSESNNFMIDATTITLIHKTKTNDDFLAQEAFKIAQVLINEELEHNPAKHLLAKSLNDKEKQRTDEKVRHDEYMASHRTKAVSEENDPKNTFKLCTEEFVRKFEELDDDELNEEEKKEFLIEHLKTLIHEGLDVSKVSEEEGETPLFMAVDLDSLELVETILSKKECDVTAVNQDGKTALFNAKSKKIVNALVVKGALLDVTDNENNTLLHKCDSFEVLEAFIGKGLKVTNTSKALQSYLRDGGEDAYKIIDLLLSIADKDQQKSMAEEALLSSGLYYSPNAEKLIKLFLDTGADINVTDENGQTPLHITSIHGKSECASLLIKDKDNATINAVNTSGKTALQITILQLAGKYSTQVEKDEYRKIAQTLIDGYGSNIIKKEEDPALHSAISLLDNDPITLQMIEDKIGTEYVTDKNKNLLQTISLQQKPSLDVVTSLINAGVDFRAKDDQGFSPLHNFAVMGQSDILREITDPISKEKIFKTEEELEDFTEYSQSKAFLGLSYSKSSFGTSIGFFDNLISDCISRDEGNSGMIDKDLAGRVISGEKILLGESGHQIEVIKASYTTHAAYFIIEYDKEQKPTKLSYCDGNLPGLKNRDQAYGSGEVIFNLDVDKIGKLQDYSKELTISERLKKRLKYITCNDKADIINETIPSILLDLTSNQDIEYQIPTTPQNRGNCSLKSFNITLRSVLNKMHPELSFEEGGKPGGDGYDAFKKYKNSLIGSHLDEIIEMADQKNKDKFWYSDVTDTLKDVIRPKAEQKKHQSIMDRIDEVLEEREIDSTPVSSNELDKGENNSLNHKVDYKSPIVTETKDDVVPEEESKKDDVVPEEESKKDDVVPEEESKKDDVVPEEESKKDDVAPERGTIEEKEEDKKKTDSTEKMNLVQNFANYSTDQAGILVEERKLTKETKDEIKELVKSNSTIFTQGTGRNSKNFTAENVAKEKLPAIIPERFVEELAKFSALGVASKAIKASFNDSIEAEKAAKNKESGSKRSGKDEVTNNNFETAHFKRHGRISFVDIDLKGAFMNSFANCEFNGNNADFSKIVENKNKFANCTFGDDCTADQIQELAKLGSNNLSGCKFSKQLIDRLTKEIGSDFKKGLNIRSEPDGDCYKSEILKTPGSSPSSITSFRVKEFNQIVTGK